MAREYMVGTVDDKPLLSVSYNGVAYFVDLESEEVFLDEPGLPQVKSKKTVEAVLKQAGA